MYYNTTALSLVQFTALAENVSFRDLHGIAPCFLLTHSFSTFVLQVVRTSGVQIGTLMYKIEESDDGSPTTSHPTIRWAVGFEGEEEGEADHQEEVSERSFSLFMDDSSNESESSTSKSSSKRAKKTVAAAKRTKSKNGRFYAQQRAKAASSNKENNGETVVQVKMLTGTLYLYRGLNPRAEFVRNV